MSERKHLPIGWLIPNLVTVAALCCGLTSIRMAIAGNWEYAYWLIFAAIFLDGMDGRLARLLKSSSTFGAQLDSLADFLSFGVAPPLVTYLWVLHNYKGLGWAAALFFAVCCALRLARFNTMLFDKKDVNSDKYFTGVPAPVGAGLALLPLVLYFQSGNSAFMDYNFVAANLVLVGFLMASRIPTLSIKRMKIRLDMALPVMLCAVLFISLLIIEPWLVITALITAYYASIPVCIFLKARADKQK